MEKLTSKDIPLESVQKWMQHTLLSRSTILKSDSGEISIDAVVKPSKRLSPQQHLAIYQRSYTARLRACMSKQFSVLEYALGKDLFQAFADEYLKVYPSSNYNLIKLGKHFPKFLEETRPDKDQDIKEDWPDFMIELAQFEFDLNTIFEERANEDYTLATDSTLERELKLVPIFYPFKYRFPIQRYYTDFKNDQKPELPLPLETYCIVKRHNYKLTLNDVNQSQFVFLKFLYEGASIEEAKARIITVTNSSESAFNEIWHIWKKEWLRLGFFTC